MPDTTFADSWESLCYELLKYELNDDSLLHLKAPEKGVDIWHRSKNQAFQCKSTEAGQSGSIPSSESIKSLISANSARSEFSWEIYTYATNARYSGTSTLDIIKSAKELGISEKNITFKGPDYWEKLCEKHRNHIIRRFDYRGTMSEEEVIEAMRKAKYYDDFLAKSRNKISEDCENFTISNNITNAEISMPFSRSLSGKNLLDAIIEILEIPRELEVDGNPHDSIIPIFYLKSNGKEVPINIKLLNVLDNIEAAEIEIFIKLRYKRKRESNSEKIALGRIGFITTSPNENRLIGKTIDEHIGMAEQKISEKIWMSLERIKNRL